MKVTFDMDGTSPSQRTWNAKAFQLGWLLVTAFIQEANISISAREQLSTYATEFGISFTCFETGRGNHEFPSNLLRSESKNVCKHLARQHPGTIRYFLSAHDLIFEAARCERKLFEDTVAGLQLPEYLRTPRADICEWANAIHSHFNEVIRESMQLPNTEDQNVV